MLRFPTKVAIFPSFWSIFFHLLSSSRFFSLALFLGSFTLASREEMWCRQEQFLAHSPHDEHRVPFPLLLTSPTQVSTLEVELGSFDSGSLER